MSPVAGRDAAVVESEANGRGSVGPLVALAAATLLVHLASGGRYGFHRDELATLEDARHLAWGYVAYPPLTPFLGRVSLELFGTSLRGFRFFAALAQAVAIVLTGLMARDLGAGRGAQLVAALAAAPFGLAAGALMQYVSFDYRAWVAACFLVLRILRSGDERLFVGLGVVIGLGMMAKYGIAFLVPGIAVGFLVTPARRHLRSRFVLLGAAAALLVPLLSVTRHIQSLPSKASSHSFLRCRHALP